MKTIAAFLCLLVAVSVSRAQATAPAKPTETKDASTAAKATDTKVVPGKTVDPKAAAAAKKDAKKEAPLPKIPGTVINRPNGTFLSLQVAGGNFTLIFYDTKHKKMTTDVTRVAARWPNMRAPGDNRTVLNGSGDTLVGSKPVVPPYNFNVYLTLIVGEGDEAKAVENYTVPFRG